MAKDIFHEAVRIALEKDGWKITDDRILLARKETDRILYLAVSKAVYEDAGVLEYHQLSTIVS